MATPDVLQTTPAMSEDFSICGICQETFNRPKVLSCLHTFCYECINKHISNHVEKQQQKLLLFACPTCDMEVELPNSSLENGMADTLKDDQFMTKFVELKRAMSGDKTCDICIRREEEMKLATNWCSDCTDALCENCTQVHSHVKVTSTHNVTSLEEMRKVPLELVMKKKNKVSCEDHEENITLFCVDCREPLCVQCMAISHRRCENVITVADAMTSRSDVDDVMGRLETLSMSAECSDDASNSEKLLADSIENAEHEIKYLSETLCEKIRTKEKSLLKLLDMKSEQARQYLKERTEPRKFYAKTVRSASQRMNNLLKYGSDVEILLAFNQVRKKLDNYDKTMADVNPDKLKAVVEFIPNEPTLSFLEEMNELGDVIIDTGMDAGISMWGVACTSLDDIIVTDCKNKRIQKFSKDGSLVDHIQLDDEPRDITTCGLTDDVAVPLIGRLIIFIATRKDLALIRRTKTERQYDGISYSDEECYLVASCLREKCVDIVQMNGDVLKTIRYGVNGESIFEEPRYVSASVDRTVVVSDLGRKSVVCVDQNGCVVFNYSGSSELKCPQGVCCDKVGNVFVADNANDRVQLLTSNGGFQRYVLVKESGLERPCAIMVSYTNKLVIVQNDGMVKVYSYC